MKASGLGDETGPRSSRWLSPLDLGVVAVVSSIAGRKMTLIFFSWMDCFEVCSMCDHFEHVSQRHMCCKGKHTRDATLVNSLSAVTSTDCTKNLSRHFASGGGSSFMACKRTGHTSACCRNPAGDGIEGFPVLCTSTSLPGSMRPELGLTQYLRAGYQQGGGDRGVRMRTASVPWF